MGTRRGKYLPNYSPLLTEKARKKRVADIARQNAKPEGHLWKVFMSVPKALRLELERRILADLGSTTMEPWDWDVKCLTLGNKAIILVIAIHKQLDRTFHKQYEFTVDPTRRERDGQYLERKKGKS